MDVWIIETLATPSTGEGELFVSILYGICLSWNKLCFENREIPMEVVLTNALSASNSFSELLQSNGNPRPHRQNDQPAERFSWKPLAKGKYKLNSNAAELGSDEWGLGALIRDEEGSVLLAACDKISLASEARLLEAVAMRWGLSLALDTSVCHMEVESDCLELVEVINGKLDDVTYLYDLARDCEELGSLLGICSFSHVRRDCNKVTHHLAKSCFRAGLLIWLEDGPTEVLELAKSDVIAFHNQ